MGDPQVNLPGCSTVTPDQHGTGTRRPDQHGTGTERPSQHGTGTGRPDQHGTGTERPGQHGTGTGRNYTECSVEGERRGGGGRKGERGGEEEGVVMGGGEGVSWRGCEEEEEVSLSQYESARGTQGRGTPPARVCGQPRLDQLFQQLHARQVGGGASGRREGTWGGGGGRDLVEWGVGGASGRGEGLGERAGLQIGDGTSGRGRSLCQELR